MIQNYWKILQTWKLNLSFYCLVIMIVAIFFNIILTNIMSIIYPIVEIEIKNLKSEKKINIGNLVYRNYLF